MRRFLIQFNSCNSMRATSASMIKTIWTSCQIGELSLQFLTKVQSTQWAHPLIEIWVRNLHDRQMMSILTNSSLDFVFVFVSFPKYIKHMTPNHDNLLETQCYSHVRPGLCESPHKMGQTLTVLKLTQVTCLDCKWAIYHAYTDETLWRVCIILMLFGWMSDRFWLPSLQ